MIEIRNATMKDWLGLFKELEYEVTKHSNVQNDGIIVETTRRIPQLEQPVYNEHGFQVYVEGEYFIWDSPIYCGRFTIDQPTKNIPDWLLEVIKNDL